MTPEDPYADLTYGGRNVGFGKKPAIAVVDLQLGFTDPKYPLGGRPLVVAATQQTSGLVRAARDKGLPVVSCIMAYKDAQDMPRWKVPAMYDGSFFKGHPATQPDPRTYDEEYDLAVAKSAPSIFFATPVRRYFSRRNVDTVIICGCMTAGCVRASVIDSFSYGWRTIVPEECVGDVDRESHDANLLDIRRRYADVLPLQQVMAYIDSLAPTPSHD